MRGFSLLELLVALAISLLALLFASRLLLESQRMLLRSSAELQGGGSGFALALLRADLQGADPPTAASFRWTRNELRLQGHAEGEVVYLQGQRELRRLVRDPTSGELLGRRVLIRELSHWRWRTAPTLPGLIEVEFGLLRPLAPRGYQLLERRRLVRDSVQSHSLRVAPRGRGGSRW